MYICIKNYIMAVHSELKNIKYDYIVNLTIFYLDKYRTKEIKTLDQLIRCIKVEVPNLNVAYTFDETLWHPEKPELYQNLIEFKVQILNYIEYLPFRLMVNGGLDQNPIFFYTLI